MLNYNTIYYWSFCEGLGSSVSWESLRNIVYNGKHFSHSIFFEVLLKTCPKDPQTKLFAQLLQIVSHLERKSLGMKHWEKQDFGNQKTQIKIYNY